MPPKKPTPKPAAKYTIHEYSVILVEHEDEEEKLFECIPDRWFIDETKNSCFWPPITGKSFAVRAINCEKPEDSWIIVECRVISGGYTTYNSGLKIVQEKCRQKYNTSSADEHINAAEYRRKHPVLAMKQNDGKIEHIFAKANATSKKSQSKQHKNDKASAKKSVENISSTSSSKMLLSDSRSVPNSSAGLTESATVETVLDTHVEELNSNFEINDQDERENDLNLDCGNSYESAKLVIGKNASSVTPQNTSDDIEILGTEAASESPASQTRSDGSRSGRSKSSSRRSISRSSRSISRSSRSISRSSRSISRSSRSISRSSHSRSRLSKSSSGRSCSSRSHSNGPSKRYTSGSNRSHSERSNSIQYISSRFHTNGSSSNRLPSKSNRCRSRSRSLHSGYNAQSHQRQSNSQHQSHSDYREIRRKEISADASFVDRTNKRRRSSKPERHSKSFKIGSHHSQSKIEERQSSSEHLSIQRSHENSRKRDVGKSHGRKNFDSTDAQSTREKKSSTNNNFTSDVSVKDLIKEVQRLSETNKENNQLLKDNDRRLHRMEVTLNKVFVLVGDLSGNCGALQDELLNDQGFEVPELPIVTTKELTVMKRKLKNKEFRAFFLQHEKDFCCPTKRSTDTMTISKYLKRFISLRVRSKLTLKENGEDGTTLFKDFHQVYLFLMDVMKAGYKCSKKTISFDDAHTALRIVWGRSKQQYRESKPKSK